MLASKNLTLILGLFIPMSLIDHLLILLYRGKVTIFHCSASVFASLLPSLLDWWSVGTISLLLFKGPSFASRIQLLVLCPSTPQLLQKMSNPSYTICCMWFPMNTAFLAGASSTTSTNIHAYLRLKAWEVHMSVLTSFPIVCSTLARI